MKRVTFKHFMLGCLLTAAISSCGNDNGGASSDGNDTTANSDVNVSGDTTSNATNLDNRASNAVDSLADKINSIFSSGNPDSSFVVNAGTQNEDEMKLLQAGIDKGTSAELKSHAKMMLADHKKMGQEVKAYAAKNKFKTFDASESKAADEMKDLNSHTAGKDWDKAWADKLVDGHEKTIRLFEKGQSNVKDATLGGMITKTLPTLQSHLTMSQSLQNSLK